MKRFNDLSRMQQDEAVGVAKKELLDLLEQGVIRFDKPVTDAVVNDFAVAAAEDAWYAEPGDKVIYEIVEGT